MTSKVCCSKPGQPVITAPRAKIALSLTDQSSFCSRSMTMGIKYCRRLSPQCIARVSRVPALLFLSVQLSTTLPSSSSSSPFGTPLVLLKWKGFTSVFWKACIFGLCALALMSSQICSAEMTSSSSCLNFMLLVRTLVSSPKDSWSQYSQSEENESPRRGAGAGAPKKSSSQ